MKCDVYIEYLNETHMFVQCDDDIAREISDFFTFEPPNAFWMRKKRPGWDGRIRIFNQDRRILYMGLLTHLLEFCSKFGYKVTLDPLMYPPFFNEKEFEDFIENLDIRDEDGNEISFYDYQEEAIRQGVIFNRRTIVSPTASGKSLIIYGFLRWYENYLIGANKKALIVVPTLSLVEQMKKDFGDYSQCDDTFNAEKNVHKIMQGEEKYNDRALIYVSTWQSIYDQPKEYFDQFGLIIGDECHQYKADAIKGILEKATSTKYRFGLTGTLTADGSACNKLIIQGLFGHQVKVASLRELMDRGIIAGIDIQIINLMYDLEIGKVVAGLEYKDEKKFITQHKPRTRFIANVASAETKNTLILFEQQKHGEALYEEIKKQNPNRPVFILYGKHPVEEREEAREIMKNNHDCIAVCSYGIFSTGVNIKNIHTVIFASSSKSQIRVLQSIGRGLRKLTGKDKLKLIDIVDVFRKSAKAKPNNYFVKHSVERIKIYNQEQFDYQTIEVEI